jgi:hypothetical protein
VGAKKLLANILCCQSLFNPYQCVLSAVRGPT